jgi:prepilin-type N-terminal cleavage/methylation domain-containing protein
MTSRSYSYRAAKGAFTLIELLVVIGIIAVLAGGIGVMLKGGNPGAALKAGQSTLMSTLAAARGQAAINQVNAMIIVDADPASETFLRSVRVVVEKTSGNWTEVGGEVIIPQGVYVVPQFGITGVTLTSGNTAGRVSDFFLTTGPVIGVTGPVTQFIQSKAFTPLGAMSAAVGGRLLVGAGTITGPNLVTIDNTNVIRGLIVSKYGVATVVNEGTSL